VAVASRVEAGPAVEWLLASDEPAIAALARRELLGEDVRPSFDELRRGPLVRGLLAGQRRDGGFGVNVYGKWGGAHWRLVSLVELGVPGEPPLLAALETVLDWLTGPGHRRRIPTIDGLTRRCASQEGNALAVACRLGLAEDERVELLARSLADWQWPDGGWNLWRPPDSDGSNVEVVDWGRGPSPMLTLNALRILRAAGRLETA